jgi:outer membrane protein assembly factor BamE (lipoprotein component of BamABCDE complex)
VSFFIFIRYHKNIFDYFFEDFEKYIPRKNNSENEEKESESILSISEIKDNNVKQISWQENNEINFKNPFKAELKAEYENLGLNIFIACIL